MANPWIVVQTDDQNRVRTMLLVSGEFGMTNDPDEIEQFETERAALTMAAISPGSTAVELRE